MILWTPGEAFVCRVCGHSSGDDPPGPWFRHRPSHRRRIPIFQGGEAFMWLATPGYLEYVHP